MPVIKFSAPTLPPSPPHILCFVRLSLTHYPPLFCFVYWLYGRFCQQGAVEGDCKAGRGRDLLLRASLLQVSCMPVVPVPPQPCFFTLETLMPSYSTSWIRFAVFLSLGRTSFLMLHSETTPMVCTLFSEVWIPATPGPSSKLIDPSTSWYVHPFQKSEF